MTLIPENKIIKIIKSIYVLLSIFIMFTGAVGVMIRHEVSINDQIELISNPNPSLQKKDATEVPPVPTLTDGDDNNYVTYLHLTKPKNAANILIYGIQPVTGLRSHGNDEKFYAVTKHRGPYPQPRNQEIADMFGDLAGQFTDDDPTLTILTRIELRIPLDVAVSLENQNFIYYQGFYKNRWGASRSRPPYTETVFRLEAFPIINQYKHLWTTVSMNLKLY